MLNKNLKLAVFYIHDFEYFDRKIGESLFFYNTDNQKFEMGEDREMAYSVEAIMDDDNWQILLIDENPKEDDIESDYECQTRNLTAVERENFEKFVNENELKLQS